MSLWTFRLSVSVVHGMGVWQVDLRLRRRLISIVRQEYSSERASLDPSSLISKDWLFQLTSKNLVRARGHHFANLLVKRCELRMHEQVFSCWLKRKSSSTSQISSSEKIVFITKRSLCSFTKEQKRALTLNTSGPHTLLHPRARTPQHHPTHATHEHVASPPRSECRSDETQNARVNGGSNCVTLFSHSQREDPQKTSFRLW